MSGAVRWISTGVVTVLLVMFIQLFISRGMIDNLIVADNHKQHVQIVNNETDTYFYSRFVLGAEKAAQEHDMFVEFVDVDKWESDALRNTVTTAIYAGVSIVAFQSNDPETTVALYDEAQAQGVELILYESESFQQVSIPSVGTNSYTTGTAAGALALEATDGHCKALLIVDKAKNDVPSAYQNIKIQGVLEAFLQSEDADIVEIYVLDGSVLAGEYLVNTILKRQSDYNTIICLHEKTTPLMAQRLIDNKLVDSVALIGYGALPQTLEYIERDVIFGTVCPDAYEVGYNTALLMYAKLNNKKVSDYSSTRLFTITKENVKQFRSPLEKGGRS